MAVETESNPSQTGPTADGSEASLIVTQEMQTNKATEAAGDAGYSIRPKLENKFKVHTVQKLIKDTLFEHLNGVKYNPETCSQLTRTLVDEIRAKIKELNLPRYKFVVTTVVGEMKGEGVRMGARCLWDVDTDNVVKEEFRNDSLFCVVAAFGVYYY